MSRCLSFLKQFFACLPPQEHHYLWMKGSHCAQPVNLWSYASQCSFVWLLASRPRASSVYCSPDHIKILPTCRIGWTGPWESVNARTFAPESAAIASGLGQSLPSTVSIARLLRLRGLTSEIRRTSGVYRFGCRLNPCYHYDRLKCLGATTKFSSFFSCLSRYYFVSLSETCCLIDF